MLMPMQVQMEGCPSSILGEVVEAAIISDEIHRSCRAITWTLFGSIVIGAWMVTRALDRNGEVRRLAP